MDGVPRLLERIGIAFAGARMGRQDRQQQTFLPGEKIVEREDAFAFCGARFSRTQKPAETAISSARRRPAYCGRRCRWRHSHTALPLPQIHADAKRRAKTKNSS